MSPLAQSYNTHTDESDFFTDLSNFCSIIGKFNYKIAPYNDKSKFYFKSLEVSKRNLIKNNFYSYSELILSAVRSGYDLRNDQSVLAHAKRKLNLNFSDKVSSFLEKGDVVEIYNLEMIQVYRNLTLLDICGYSLLELVTYEFYELYERSIQVNQYLLSAFEEIKTSNFDSGVPLFYIPKHLMREKFSPNKNSSVIQFKSMFAVNDENHKPYGLLVIQSVQPEIEKLYNVAFI